MYTNTVNSSSVQNWRNDGMQMTKTEEILWYCLYACEWVSVCALYVNERSLNKWNATYEWIYDYFTPTVNTSKQCHCTKTTYIFLHSQSCLRYTFCSSIIKPLFISSIYMQCISFDYMHLCLHKTHQNIRLKNTLQITWKCISFDIFRTIYCIYKPITMFFFLL